MSSPEPQIRKVSNARNLVAAYAAISVFGLAFGMTYPLLALVLEARGVSADMIGINSAMMPVGILLFSSVIPVTARRFGARNTAIAAAVTTAVLILGYKALDTLEAWFVLRLLQGMAISTLFVLSEVWIVANAGDAHRGKVVALYASILSASFGAGPAIVGWIGIEGWLPFVVGALVIMLGVVPLAFIREAQAAPPRETTPSGFFSFATKAPVLLAAVGTFAIFDASSMSLLPVYGIRLGLEVQMAAIALTALVVGNVVLQFPIGWLADRLSRRWVLAGCATATAGLVLLLPLVMTSAWRWPVLVLTGASAYGVYTVALTSLGDRFEGDELVQGSAAFAVMWGVGALVGSVSGGAAMTTLGPHGLPMLIAAVHALLVAGLALRGLQLARIAMRGKSGGSGTRGRR